MATLRSSVNEDDGYIKKIIKYIPAEIITAYTGLLGYLSFDLQNPVPKNYLTYYLIMVIILVIVTPTWTYFATLDQDQGTADFKKRARFQAIVALLAFLVWIYALGSPLLKMIICNVLGPFEDCIWYSPVLASIILVLFTLLTPLAERIFLGTKFPG